MTMRDDRLGLFIDGPFRLGESGQVFTNDEEFGFMRFAAAVGRSFGRFALIARAAGQERTPYELPAGVELVPLPDYGSLRRIGRLLAAIPRTVRRMWRALDELDVVWVTGVHPLGLLMALLTRVRGRRLVLLIRQDSPQYFRTRLPSRRWAPLLAPILFLDWCFRVLARRTPVTVVGADIGLRYGAPRPGVLEMHVTLLEDSQIAAEPSRADWSGEIGLLTVGRVAPEKNPMAAAEMLRELDRGEPGRFRLTWVGEGPEREALARRAAELGIGDRLELPGYVPFGEDLLRLYREAHAFVHISFTEGVPGVLFEAMGWGLPIVATDVGGVRQALAGGEAGLLVPPSDVPALTAAVRRLESEPAMRRELSERALDTARRTSLESESRRVADFIAGGSSA
jgi:glycosyltransferase involved in cell wall biosynthesis